MTDTPKRPLVTRTGILTGLIAFTLPFIADRVIVSAMTAPKATGMGVVVGTALYTAAPFVLLDSAMRPRRRVRLALWMGLALTVLIWAAYAQTGYAFQSFAETANVLRESCNALKEEAFKVLPELDKERLTSECATYRQSGSAHTGLYMLTMMWPAAVVAIMGAAAKIGEPAHDA